MQVITTNEPIKPSLIPEAVVNLYQAVNALTRVVRITCESTERLVIGADEITSLVLHQQHEKLLSELSPRPQLT